MRFASVQQATLASAPDQPAAATWHRDIAEVPDGPAIIIANEFLDALPIRQLVVRRRCMARARRGAGRGRAR